MVRGRRFASTEGLSRLRLGLVLWLVLVGTALASVGRPIIEPGRESEILELLAPHQLQEPVSPSWSLHSLSVDRATIHLWIAGPDQRFAHVTLDHPDQVAQPTFATPSFGVTVVEQPAGSEDAVAVLLQALERNDDGSFWDKPFTGRTSNSTEAQRSPTPSIDWSEWLRDGLVFLAGLVVVLAVLVVRLLRKASATVAWSLGGIAAVGVALRIAMPVEVSMAPWSYTRVLLPAALTYEGPALSLLSSESVWLSDVITGLVWGAAMLAPVAAFVHARYLLADDRAALVVAGLMAVLPIHLRFSHSDAAFIPSITLSSIAFALVHAATREPSRTASFAALVPLPLVIGLTYLVRPLNIVYFPLFLATAFVNEGIGQPKQPPTRLRLALVGTVVTLATFGIGVPHLLNEFGSEVREGLSPKTLVSAIGVLFSPVFNTLINPEMTPPGFTLLAIIGAVGLLLRRRWRLFSFLVGWLTALLVTHAYVVPVEPYMQARYHLHLAVPFLLLCGCGFEVAADRLKTHPWRRPVALGFGLYVAASPLIHRSFIRKTDFNDLREWKFVHGLRDTIPPGCTIVEFTGERAGTRFERVGAHLRDGRQRWQWTVVESESADAGSPLSDEVLGVLRDPPECVYVYQGLPCFGMKSRDDPIAPACSAVLEHGSPVEVASTRFESRPYDDNLARGLGAVDRIELVLYRLRPHGQN